MTHQTQTTALDPIVELLAELGHARPTRQTTMATRPGRPMRRSSTTATMVPSLAARRSATSAIMRFRRNSVAAA
jgi:hypothetical protein